MTLRVLRPLALLAACVGLAVPAVAGAAAPATAGTGGSGGAGITSTTTAATTSGPQTDPGTGPNATPVSSAPVSASGDGLTLQTAAMATYGHTVTLSGTAPAASSGQTVAIQRSVHSGWKLLASAPVGSAGRFSATWQASASGRVSLRAALIPATRSVRRARASSRADATPATAPLAITIFRDAVATIYGPGFWGHRTACGLRLEPDTLGVASRTLRCGTRVSIVYGGRTITVPVIDRGPYSNGATWDLTEATARALDDVETATVGTAVL